MGDGSGRHIYWISALYQGGLCSRRVSAGIMAGAQGSEWGSGCRENPGLSEGHTLLLAQLKREGEHDLDVRALRQAEVRYCTEECLGPRRRRTTRWARTGKAHRWPLGSLPTLGSPQFQARKEAHSLERSRSFISVSWILIWLDNKIVAKYQEMTQTNVISATSGYFWYIRHCLFPYCLH